MRDNPAAGGLGDVAASSTAVIGVQDLISACSDLAEIIPGSRRNVYVRAQVSHLLKKWSCIGKRADADLEAGFVYRMKKFANERVNAARPARVDQMKDIDSTVIHPATRQ